MLEVLRQTLDAQESLPPTLILQLDNTSQENKNAMMFALNAEFVETGIFEKVIINFLPVGHTHVSIFLREDVHVLLLGGHRPAVFLYFPCIEKGGCSKFGRVGSISLS